IGPSSWSLIASRRWWTPIASMSLMMARSPRWEPSRNSLKREAFSPNLSSVPKWVQAEIKPSMRRDLTSPTRKRGNHASSLARRAGGSQTCPPGLRLSQRHEQFFEGGRVHRLDQVIVKSRFFGLPSIFLLPPAGQCDQNNGRK